MGTKNNPGSFDCYHNALLDEPMFVLLARDVSAAEIVRQWVRRCLRDIEEKIRPESDRAMAKEAYECAEAMDAWRMANLGRWRKRGK